MRHVAPLLLLLSSAASAQEMDLFGFQPRAIGMGGVQAASEGDYTAAYYNPALLRGGSVGVGYIYQQPFFHETLVGSATTGTVSVHQLTDSEGYAFGFAVPLGGILKDRATIGLAGYIPSSGLYNARLIDDGSAVFYRYEDAPNQFQLIAAASAQPLRWLSLGLGAQVFGNVGGAATFSAHLNNTPSANGGPPAPGFIRTSELDSNTLGAAAPIAGLAVGPFKGFKATAVWRGKAEGSYTLPITVALDQGTGTLTVAVQGYYHFSPDEFGLGVSQELWHHRLLLALDLGYELWSEAPPPIAIIGVGLPSVLSEIGYSPTISPQSATPGFLDTFVPRAGAEWRATDRLSVRAGYYFRPSIVPNQSASPDPSQQTNALFLDADTHVLSAGAGYAFDDPLKLAHRLVLEAAVQLGITVPRDYQQDNTVGKLTYQTSGVTLATPISVRYDF